MSGTFRDQLSDFQVYERFDRTLSGAGEHLYLHIEKRGLNTKDVQLLLAQHYGVPPVDVSYAGLKDKWAITRQWFSVRLPKTTREPAHEEFSVLEKSLHHKKLRRGDHRANRFQITIRNVSPTAELDSDFLHRPIPNYFGPQRFGYQQNNIVRALQWVERSRPRVAREVRSLHLSVLRSFLFNELLARRIRAGTWNKAVPGDILQEDFATGPLWGRGQLPSSGEALTQEQAVQAQHRLVSDALEWVGLKQERRALGMHAKQVECHRVNDIIELQFTLPKGSYATVALNEYFDLKESRA